MYWWGTLVARRAVHRFPSPFYCKQHFVSSSIQPRFSPFGQIKREMTTNLAHNRVGQTCCHMHLPQPRPEDLRTTERKCVPALCYMWSDSRPHFRCNQCGFEKRFCRPRSEMIFPSTGSTIAAIANSFLVSVPVLSVQITWTAPSVSTASKFLTRTCFLAIRKLAIDRAKVNVGRRPSGWPR